MLRMLVHLLVTFSFLSTAHAELYQWTDAQGQTHFSDKKPEAAASQAVKLPDSGAMREFETQPAQPRAFSAGISRLLLMKPVQLAPANSNKADPVIGNYHFGPDCVSPTSITLKDWRLRYPDADPMEQGYFQSALEALGSYGFTSMHLFNAYPMEPNSVILEVTITDMQLLACAQKTKPEGKYTAHDFKRSAARLGITWTFRDAADRKVIYEASTIGVANVPVSQIQLMNNALTRAFGDALLHLLEDASIGKLLVSPATAADASAATDDNWINQAAQLPKALYDRYVQRAKLAEILALLSPLKSASTEYYLSNGEWPDRLDQLLLSPVPLSHPGRIASVSLRSQGEIVADISPVFGAGAHLTLAPIPTMGGTAMQWRCAARLDSPALLQWLQETCGH